ncbi:DUF1254 domain-containing protein [Sediminitomix flava]|uniref:Uncharacterized protein DUF1254 n=1 Tax=Sediminitomix flava TaxID=379075 RepID=A0A315ZCF9_SEDFL|nr:DUF1254 domain-containing protein [Sediminitomix flava]PWJ42424.1 uncharacterized protein DUF1254 [Sediminitomix flava]
MKNILIFIILILQIACSTQKSDKAQEKEFDYIKEKTADGKIKVDESNFTIAETDLYMLNHSKEHDVNTFRHARQMSDKDNQFVVRENQDVMYSHAVVDISEGATLVNPEWDVYSVIQVLDENQYTIGVVYPGESKTFTTDDVALGNHLFLNMRTGVRTLDSAGYAEAHEHQDNVQILANSNTAYHEKGFDQKSLDETRKRLKARMKEADKPAYYFGTKDEVDSLQFLIASAVGIFGLPVEHAAYLNTIQPNKEIQEGKCASLTLPIPPIQFDKGGFFSVTTYNKEGWIATDNFALNNRMAKANDDGTYTFHFNCPDKKNNIDVVPGWAILIRLYRPESKSAILDYMSKANQNIKFELLQD